MIQIFSVILKIVLFIALIIIDPVPTLISTAIECIDLGVKKMVNKIKESSNHVWGESLESIYEDYEEKLFFNMIKRKS